VRKHQSAGFSKFKSNSSANTYFRHISSIALTGLLFGAIFFGYLSDKIGRKRALLVAAIGAIVFGVCVGLFSNNLYLYILFRFLSNMFVHGGIPISVVYSLEFVPAEYRPLAIGVGFVIFDSAVAMLSLIGYLFTTWRMQAIVIALFPLPFFLVYFVMPESIQYLYSSGQIEQGKAELKVIMQRTKSDMSKLDKTPFFKEQIEPFMGGISTYIFGNGGTTLCRRYQ